MKNIIIDKPVIQQKNIDYQEIKKFNIFSDQWWKSSNTNNAFQCLHNINKIRLNYILEHSNGLFGKKVLDIGCGGGILSESMAKEGANVVGLDISNPSLEAARLHAFNNNLSINYIQETIETHIRTYNNYYDVITCMEMLEHVPCPESIVHASSIAIKKKGSVFFSTLNRTLISWLLIIIGSEYMLKIIPKNTHKFNKFIAPNELLNWIDSSTLEEKNITGLFYNPFTKVGKLTCNINMNYILHTQRVL